MKQFQKLPESDLRQVKPRYRLLVV
jgi:hypothetical protein